MSVHMPPRMLPKASGMSSFDGLNLDRRASTTAAGVNIAVTVVLFMKPEIAAAVSRVS